MTRKTAARPRGPGRPRGRTASDGVVADREALLAAAERLVRRGGPSVSLDAIAREAGVTKPILYRGVGDKDALVVALAERLVTRMTDAVTAIVAAAPGPRERLHALVRGFLEQAVGERHLYLYVTAGGTGDDRLQQSLLVADRTASGFAEGIAAFRVQQGTDPAVARSWAYAMLGALHYTTLWWLRDGADAGGAAGAAAVAEHVTALLWSGLGGPDVA